MRLITEEYHFNKAINILLNSGADVNKQNTDGSTPAIGCCWEANRTNLHEIFNILEILKQKGANLSTPNKMNETAFSILNKREELGQLHL